MGSEGVTWTVVNQREDFRDNGFGKYVDGMTVTIRTGANHTGSLFFPMPEYTAANVRQQAGQLAVRLDEVGALTGG